MNEITIYCDANPPDHPGFTIPKVVADFLGVSNGDRLAHDWYMKAHAVYQGWLLALTNRN